jgi:hypothetical protein
VGVSLSVEAKQKILGLNACKLYDIDPAEHAPGSARTSSG